MNCDLSFAPAPSLVVAKPGEAASVRFSRCAPYTLSGGLARFLPCLRLISSPLNLLPMFPNDCYPCPRPKQRSETATLADPGAKLHRSMNGHSDAVRAVGLSGRRSFLHSIAIGLESSDIIMPRQPGDHWR